MKKNIFQSFCLFLIVLYICRFPIQAIGDNLVGNNGKYAQALNDLGLFQGTEVGYELDREPSRAEALVMLLRLLGCEKEAAESNFSHPFLDTGWADKYVGYAYKNRLTSGKSETLFGSKETGTVKQYCTFLLRALGYSDSVGGQFTYDGAIDFAESAIGLENLSTNTQFTRGDMARLSWAALGARRFGSSNTLAEELILRGVFTDQQYQDALTRTGENKKVPATTTVLIYMIGSDLESCQGRATADINEIINAKSSPSTNIVLQSGGTSNWKNNWMTDGKTQRFFVEENNLKQIETLEQEKMTDAASLTNFIRWASATYPADRYILILWDHGDGTLGGFGRDELNGNKTMRLGVLRQALFDAGIHFDLIGFDACLMSTLETAYALCTYGDEMISSEELTPACGWYYTTWLNVLAETPGIANKALAKLICDSFTFHAGIEANSVTTISVLQLDRIKWIYQSLNDLFELMVTDKALTDAFNQAIKGATVFGKSDGGYDQFDLIKVMEDFGLSDSQKVIATVRNAIVYSRNSPSVSDANGLAFYVPYQHFMEYATVYADMKTCGYEDTYFTVFNRIVKQNLSQ
jgi:Clostripain family.